MLWQSYIYNFLVEHFSYTCITEKYTMNFTSLNKHHNAIFKVNNAFTNVGLQMAEPKKQKSLNVTSSSSSSGRSLLRVRLIFYNWGL